VRSRSPATRPTAGKCAIFGASGFLDPDKPIRKYTQAGAPRLPLQGADQGEGRAPEPHLRGPSSRGSRSRFPVQGTSRRCSRTSGRSWSARSPSPTAPSAAAPGSTRAARSSKIKKINIAEACAMQINDLAGWARGLDEPVRRTAPGVAAAHARLVRGDRAGLPQPRPAVRHAGRAVKPSAPR